VFGLALASGSAVPATAAPLKVAATHRVYADIASEIGGKAIRTHLWRRVPRSAQQCRSWADIIIYDGNATEPTRPQLRRYCQSAKLVIRMRDLAKGSPPENPALWYQPGVIPRLANVLTAEYIRLDSKHRHRYARALGRLMARLRPAYQELARLKRRVAGLPVVVQGPAATGLGAVLSLRITRLRSRNGHLLFPKNARALLYDTRSKVASRKLTTAVARTGLAAFQVKTAEPAGTHYPSWLLHQYRELAQTLTGKPPPH